VLTAAGGGFRTSLELRCFSKCEDGWGKGRGVNLVLKEIKRGKEKSSAEMKMGLCVEFDGRSLVV